MLGGCDIRVACPEAKFAVMEPKRGLFAGGGTTVRLPRQIPWPQAMEFLLCADLIPAERALRDGSAQRDRPAGAAARQGARVRGAHDRQRAARGAGDEGERAQGPLRRRGRDHAGPRGRAARCAPRSSRSTRPIPPPRRPRSPRASRCSTKLGKELRTAFEKESRISSAIFQTEDAKEGPKAFAEKRKPVWQAQVSATVDPRTPCIIGVAAHTWHPEVVGRGGRARAARDVGARRRGWPSATRASPGVLARARQHPDRVLPDVGVRRRGRASRRRASAPTRGIATTPASAARPRSSS